MNNKQSIYSFTLQALEEKIVSLGLKKYNALQIFQWIYQKNCQSFLNMSNIAKTSLAILENNFEINKLQIENK
jgi:23S rRNA (adenine2503-C2)-methyltransferase